MTPPPPQLIKLSEVPRYLWKKHRASFTRQTIYNWAKVGVKGDKLMTMKVGCYIRTTKGYVDAFLSRLEQQRPI